MRVYTVFFFYIFSTLFDVGLAKMKHSIVTIKPEPGFSVCVYSVYCVIHMYISGLSVHVLYYTHWCRADIHAHNDMHSSWFLTRFADARFLQSFPQTNNAIKHNE